MAAQGDGLHDNNNNNKEDLASIASDTTAATRSHADALPPPTTKTNRGLSDAVDDADDGGHETKIPLDRTVSAAVGNENGAVIEETPATVSGGEELEYIGGVKLLAVFMGVVLTCFLILLDATVIVTAIPYITSRFHSLEDVGWYGAAYLLSNAALQPLSGKVYTYFNSKWAYLSFLAVFELGSLISAVATSSDMFIAGRAISGIGASGLFNGGLTIIAACIPMAKRPMYTGILMACAQLGVLLGPVLGGALTEYSTWRWCFYLNLPCGGAVAGALLLIHVPDRHVHLDEPWYKIVLHKFDLTGFVLFVPAMIMLLLAVEWGGTTYAWSDSRIIGLFCGFGATFALFVFAEYRVGDKAMIPLSLVRQRVVWCSCLVMCLLFASLLTTSYYLPIYFQTVRGSTPTMSGVYLLPTVIPQMIGAIASGVLISKFGYVPVYGMVGGSLSAISLGLLSMLGPHTSTGKWIGYQIPGGFGRGLGMQMAIIAVQNHTAPSILPTAMAIVMFSQTLGGSLFLSFDQTLFSAELRRALARFAPQVSAGAVANAGATAVRKTVSAADLPEVVKAFALAIDRTFYLVVGASVAYALLAIGMGWKDVSGKAAAEKKKQQLGTDEEKTGSTQGSDAGVDGGHAKEEAVTKVRSTVVTGVVDIEKV